MDLQTAENELKVLLDEVDEFASREGTLDEDAEARFDALVTDEVPKAQARLKQLTERAEKVRALQAASLELNTTEPAGTGHSTTRAKKSDPFDLAEVAFGAMTRDGIVDEYRSRALDAIERAPEYVTDAHRQSAAVLVDRDEDGEIAKWCIEHGSPEYTREWLHYMKTGEARAALSTTGANGGFMIPFHLDPTIILTNSGASNPFRAISRVETITTNVWHGVSSAGVTAEWTAEAAEVADASPTFAQPTVTPIRADAYVQASFEVTQDSNIAAQVGTLFADAKDRLEAAAFATGTGSTQPEGLVTRLLVTTNSKVSANTNATFTSVDVFALVNNLPERHQQNPSFLAHRGIYNNVRNFTSSASPQAGNFWVDLGPGIPSQLLGVPAYLSSAMTSSLSTATASNDAIMVLGDFSNFLIVDRVGMEVVYQPLVLGSNRRPTGEVGWAAFWRVGSDTTNADGFRLLIA